MLYSIQERSAGDPDHAVQGPVQLEDEKDRGGDRARAHRQDREGGGIGWREKAKADEQEGQPEDEDEEERARELGVRFFQQEPPGLTEITHDLLGLGEDLALRLALRGELA